MPADTKTPKLPLTYYDILQKKRPDFLFDLARLDIAALADGDPEPVGSCALLPSAQNYMDRNLEVLIEASRRMLPAASDDEIFEALEGSPHFEQLEYTAEMDYLTVFNFERYGRKTFFVAPNLAEHLAHTSLNVPSEFVRAPFKSCLFVFTDPVTISAFYQIEGIAPLNTTDPLNVFLVERPNEAGLRTLIFFCLHADEEFTHRVVKRQLLIREDWDIERMLTTDWEQIYKLPEDEAVDERRFYEDGLLFFRIVVNALLYLGSTEPDVMECLSPRGALEARAQESGKWKKLRRRAQNLSDLPFTCVGGNLGAITVAKPEEASEPAGRPPAYRIGTRFMVRGHWRQQPVGVQGAQRKLIWIRPYFKGPEMAELVNRPYDVR